MKTLIKVLAMTVLMAASVTVFAKETVVKSQTSTLPMCFSEQAFGMFKMNVGNQQRLLASGDCVIVMTKISYEVLQSGSLMTAIQLYDANDNLTNVVGFVSTEFLPVKRQSSTGRDLVMSLGKKQSSDMAPEPILNAPLPARENHQHNHDADMDAFLKSAIVSDTKKQDRENEGD